MSTRPTQSSDASAISPTSERGADALLERLRVATRGEYDIYGELGRGGMSTVYLAHEISLDRKVAIKVMAPEMLHGSGMIERFKREARTAANLSHANIIPIYAVREVDDLLFCVIKLVKGTPLDAIIKEVGKLPIPMVQAILAQVGDALGYAHRHGVVHRDIKPGNILIDDEGWAVVTDFGIAKVMETEGLTMTGVAVGTPTYMSPEQCSGDDVTGAADQYSLGIVAYEMLAGRPPFAGTSMMALMYSHFHDEPAPLETLRPDCPAEMRAVVTRMLRKDPADRWGSVEASVLAMGARPLAHDDPTRSQLITLARTGTTHRIVSQVQTPRSPIPLGRKRDDAPSRPEVVTPKRSPLLLGGAAVALLAIGYFVARLASPGAAPNEAPHVSTAAVAPASSRAAAPTGATPRAASDSATTAPGARVPSVAAVTAPTRQPAPPTVPRGEPAGIASAASVAKGEGKAMRTATVSPPTTIPSTVPAVAPSVVPPVATTRPSSTVVIPPPQTLTPPPLPSAAAKPAADDVADVRATIQSFAGALAVADLATARRLYPAMPNDQRDGLQALWKDGGTMTPKWTISDITVDGNVASARIEGENAVVMRRGQSSKVPVSLRARLERRGAEWRLLSLVN